MTEHGRLKAKILDASSMHEQGKLSDEEYRMALKGYYEEYLELKNETNHKIIQNLTKVIPDLGS